MLLTTIDIRFATSNDAPLIAELSRKTFYDSFAADNTKENMDIFMREKFSKELLMAEVGTKGNIFLLAYYKGSPAGYARLRENNNPPQLGTTQSLEIARIYAVKEVIGKGVGSALMSHSLAIAEQKHKRWAWLGVWEKNQRAIGFYKKWGFEKFDEHTFILGYDVQRDWLMKKVI